MPRITGSDGVLSGESYVEAKFNYVCGKGRTTTVEFLHAEGVVAYARQTFGSMACVCCGEAVYMPRGDYRFGAAGFLLREVAAPTEFRQRMMREFALWV